MAEALYRKYRPQIFEDVVGQEHIQRTLKNAIEADKVSHAYLFTGPRGTGKTTTARLLAKALLCENGPTPHPDGTCEDCELVAAGEHPDVYELDAASRTGVENVREEIIGRVSYAPTRGRYKIYIIDEVHMLSTAAFNALLKTLEEPPDHVVFVLCTTDPQKVPETIHSRCQRFDFRRISNEELVSRLGAICEMEGIDFEGDALELIAHRADGGMRDALTSLEQLIAFGEGSVSMQQAERLLGGLDSSDLADIVRAIGTRDVAAAFRWTTEYMETGADLARFAQDLASHMRDMYVMQLTDADTALDITESARRELESESVWFGPDRLANLLGVMGDLISELKTSTNQRLSFEIALTRLVRPDSDLTLAALADRVEALEAGASAGAPLMGAAAGGVPVAVASDASAAAAGAQPAQAAAAQPSANAAAQRASADAGTAATTDAQAGQPTQAAQAAEQAAQAQSAAQVAQPVSEPAASAVASQSAQAQAQSQAQAQATSQGSGALPDESQLPRFWETVLAHVKKANQAYAVLLMNTRVRDDGGKLAILFPPDAEFAFQASQKPEVKETIASCIAAAGASGVPFAFEKSTTSGAGAAPEAQPTAAQGGGASSAPSAAAAAAQQTAATSAAQPQAQAQTQQVQQAQQTQEPQQAQAAPTQQAAAAQPQPSDPEPSAPPVEEVPLSVYEEADAMTPPWEDDSASSAADPAPQASAATQAAGTQPGAQPDAAEPTADQLNDALAAAFGEGITFQQVD